MTTVHGDAKCVVRMGMFPFRVTVPSGKIKIGYSRFSLVTLPTINSFFYTLALAWFGSLYIVSSVIRCTIFLKIILLSERCVLSTCLQEWDCNAAETDACKMVMPHSAYIKAHICKDDRHTICFGPTLLCPPMRL